MATTTPLFLILILITATLHLSNSFYSNSLHGHCKPSGFLRGKSGHCNPVHSSDCCKAGKKYPQFRCSPPLTGDTPATMTINSCAEGNDGGGRSECDDQWHGDSGLVVALSTGWYDGGRRCLKSIRIDGNGKSVLAKVVDECDSVNGCDDEHDFQPPCPNNIVDASPAVWKALGIHGSEVGEYPITWSEE